MKNCILLLVFFFATTYSILAQDIAKNAIGIRIGDNDGFGTGVNYQRSLGYQNRLELGLGWRDAIGFNAYRITGIYQWVWYLEGNLNWYAGAGLGTGSFDFDNNVMLFENASSFFINAVGNIGIEYNFDLPFLLSLDFRPEIGLLNDIDDSLEFDFALGIRYQF